MKVFRMNEHDTVLHFTLDEAIKFYNDVTGCYEECKDDQTGMEYDIEKFVINVNEFGDEPKESTVENALYNDDISFPSIFSTQR